jgi:hypothetical protein
VTQEHPITPPPELVQCFLRSNPVTPTGMTYEQFIATRFAQWGANQELEACCEWLAQSASEPYINALRIARRPKPPSLKEQRTRALEALERMQAHIVRALEALDD